MDSEQPYGFAVYGATTQAPDYYQCGFCPSQFSTRDELFGHCNETHGGYTMQRQTPSPEQMDWQRREIDAWRRYDKVVKRIRKLHRKRRELLEEWSRINDERPTK